MKDQKIISQLCASPTEVNLALAHLQKKMKTIPILRKWILMNGGNIQDFEDIAAEALFAMYQSVRDLKFRHEVSLANFFLVIGKNKWRSRVPKEKRIVLVDDDRILEENLSKNNERDLYSERSEKIAKAFNLLSSECKDILTLYYYNSYSLEAIASELAIEYQSAKNKIFRCRKRLKKLLT